MSDSAQRGSGAAKRPTLNLGAPARRAPSLEENLKGAQGGKLERLTIDVPADFKKRLKMKAVEEGTTVRQIVLDAVEKVLD